MSEMNSRVTEHGTHFLVAEGEHFYVDCKCGKGVVLFESNMYAIAIKFMDDAFVSTKTCPVCHAHAVVTVNEARTLAAHFAGERHKTNLRAKEFIEAVSVATPKEEEVEDFTKLTAKPSVVPCGRGFVLKWMDQYFGRSCKPVDTLGLPADCVVTDPFPTREEAARALDLRAARAKERANRSAARRTLYYTRGAHGDDIRSTGSPLHSFARRHPVEPVAAASPPEVVPGLRPGVSGGPAERTRGEGAVDLGKDRAAFATEGVKA